MRPKTKQPHVSVIVVTYNAAPYIKKCIASILANTFSDFELIVFDNVSTDTTTKLAASFSDPRIQIHTASHNLGYAGGNNAAIALSKGAYVCVLNPDVIVGKRFLEGMVSELTADPTVAACQPLVYFYDGKKINLTGISPQFLGFNDLNNFDSEIIPKKGDITAFSGSGFMIRKTVLERVGTFDEQYFMYFEDSDLSWRIRLAGQTIRFVPESTMRHDYKYTPSNTSQSMMRKLFFYERNRLLTLFKNYSPKLLILSAPALILTEIGMIAKSLVEGWLGTKLRTYVSATSLIPHVLTCRKNIARFRQLSDREVIRDLKPEITFKKFQTTAVTTVLNPFLKAYFAGVSWVVRVTS